MHTPIHSSPPILPPLPPVSPAYAIEARRTGPDGSFWPARRHEMRADRAIVERMAEDLHEMTGGAAPEHAAPVTRTDLIQKGWMLEQVERLGPAAVAELMRRMLDAALAKAASGFGRALLVGRIGA